MLSRRDALKIGAAGLVTTTLLAGCGDDSSSESEPTSAPTESSPPTPVATPATPAATPVATPAPEATPMSARENDSVQMFLGNAGRTGEQPGPAPSMDESVVIKWQFSHNGGYIVQPLVDNDVVYFGSSDNNLYAVTATTGEALWRFPTDASSEWPPAIVDGTVFSGGNNLYAINAETGQEQWHFGAGNQGQSTPGANNPTFFSPAIADDMVYVGNETGNLYAINTTTGEEHWRFMAGNDSTITFPTLGNGMVFIANGNGSISAIDAIIGEEIWRFSLESSMPLSLPVFADDIIYINASDGYVYAIDAASGEELWRFRINNPSNSIAVANGMVFSASVGTPLTVFAINAQTGEEQWRFNAGNNISELQLPLTVVDGVLYVYGYDDSLIAVDTAMGTRLWDIPVTLNVGLPTVVNNSLIIGDSRGNVYSIANPLPMVLQEDVTLRGAPSNSGVERGTAVAGDEIDHIGEREESTGVSWIQVTINGVHGWIPLDAIDPATLQSEGAIDLRFWFNFVS